MKKHIPVSDMFQYSDSHPDSQLEGGVPRPLLVHIPGNIMHNPL